MSKFAVTVTFFIEKDEVIDDEYVAEGAVQEFLNDNTPLTVCDNFIIDASEEIE